jgi:phosphatidate cytidylyltransferase
MKKLIQRFLVFIIGLPLIVGVVYFLPQRQQLAVNILVVIFSALGALELAAIFKEKGLVIHPLEALILGAVMPAVQTAVVSFGLNEWFVSVCFVSAFGWILLSRIFFSGKIIEQNVSRFAASLSVLVYPGLLMEWIIRMGTFGNSRVIILLFFGIVFANDSAAWASGMLFGKNNRGIVPVSPHKSVAGFIGGAIASITTGAAVVMLLPRIFNPRFGALPGFSAPICAGAGMGLLAGLAAALGDLGESALKRSCGIKDSGHLIPGRGGVLDSIDSVALAAPVFYFAYKLFFIP